MHQHAEVLRAIAEGIPVQYQVLPGTGPWITREDIPLDKDPITHHFYEWRVKPRKVSRWQWIYMDQTRVEPRLTTGFYQNADDVKASDSDITSVIGKAEWTRVEFDE